MDVRQLSILGVGLLGGSVGLACRSFLNNCKIIGYGHRKESLEEAVLSGAIDRGVADAAEAVEGADLVILCTPVGRFGDLLRQIGPSLKKGAIVTDVGSTKRSVVAEAEKWLPQGVAFVGSHPMAGSEKRGVRFARADLFRDALCIVTPTAKTDAEAIGKVEGFWKMLGMRTTRMSAEEHDRLVGMVSHVPHAVAAALVAIQPQTAAALAGKGFFDTTRIAEGDGGLWRDILLDNADNVREGILRLQGELTELLKRLDGSGALELQTWLDESAHRRQLWAKRKLPEQDVD
jgi:prephenate dehydrogenase